MRSARGPAHVRTGLAGKSRTSRTTTGYRDTDCACRRGPQPAAGCRGMMGGPPQSPRRAAHPGPAISAIPASPGGVECAAAMRVRPAYGRWSFQSRRRHPWGTPCDRRKHAHPAAGERCSREASLLMSCLALLLCQRRCQPAHRALPSTCALQGVRQRRPLAEAQRDAEFHVAGCRRAVGCGLQLADAATIGAAWKTSPGSNYLAVAWRRGLPACARWRRHDDIARKGVCGCP